MRSARFAIAAAVGALILSPFAMLLLASAYESAIVSSYQRRLEHVAAVAAVTPEGAWSELAAREGVWLRRVSPSGVEQFGDPRAAIFDSGISELVESALARLGADTPFEPLAAVALEAPPASGSRASESGQTLVVTAVRPLADGATLIAMRANHRGVRQLLLVRRQLAKLVLYEVVVAVAVAALLSRWLLTPLQRLTARARAYPRADVADPGLLARKDELGQLTRAFTALTQSLEQRRQETVDLAADIAHELKNPLATILAASERGEHRLVGDSVARLNATVDALLSLVRLESALRDAPRDVVELSPWLEALLDTYRQDPRYEGWRFEVDATCAGSADLVAAAWASMLRNLVENACVQPSTERRVRVRAFRDASALVTEVIDFGPGVSEGNRGRVFERFFTARPAGVARGTGLGLAIVRTVAEGHGGVAELLPQAAGRGAAFRVTIPTQPHRCHTGSSERPRAVPA